MLGNKQTKLRIQRKEDSFRLILVCHLLAAFLLQIAATTSSKFFPIVNLYKAMKMVFSLDSIAVSLVEEITVEFDKWRESEANAINHLMMRRAVCLLFVLRYALKKKYGIICEF